MSERKVSEYMPSGQNADGSRKKRRIAGVKRAEQLYAVIAEHQGQYVGFYNKKCGFTQQQRHTAERYLLEDGHIVKTGKHRGAKLWITPKTQEWVEGKALTEYPTSKVAVPDPVPVVQGRNQTVVFSGFPAMLADRCAKLEERVFYLEAALEEYIEGNLTLNQLKQVYGELTNLRRDA